MNENENGTNDRLTFKKVIINIFKFCLFAVFVMVIWVWERELNWKYSYSKKTNVEQIEQRLAKLEAAVFSNKEERVEAKP